MQISVLLQRWIRFSNHPRFSQSVVILLFGLIFVQIVFWQPFYGVMDDAGYLTGMLPAMRQTGLWAAVQEWGGAGAASWGFFRPVHPVMVWLIYSVGEAYGPVVFYLFNAAIVVLALYLNASIFAEICGLDRWQILLCTLAFPYTIDLFMHPSLQEKPVLIFGALLLFAAYNPRSSFVRQIAALTLWGVLGISSKPQFLIYLGMAALVFVSRERLALRRGRLTLLYIIMLCIASAVLVAGFGMRGGYTSGGYSTDNAITNAKSIFGLFYLLSISMGIVKLVVPAWCAKAAESLLPLAGTTLFTAMLLPWMLFHGYILSVSAPLVAALALQIVPRQVRFSSGGLVVLAVFAAGMSTYRTASIFSKLGDIRYLVTHGSEYEAAGITEIAVPCMEGSGAINAYLAVFGGTKLSARYLKPDMVVDQQVLFYARGMCPLSQKQLAEVAACSEQSFYSGPLPGDFRLARYVCAD